MFGRWLAPSMKLLVLVFWLTPIGKPLCIWITAETVQLPRIALATLLSLKKRRPSPNGSCTVGVIDTLCGESSRLRSYSASGLK